MSKTKIYLELAKEIEELMADNEISIEEILEREHIEAEVTSGVVPYQSEEGARTKDIVTIILASSAAVAAIGFAFSQVLHEVSNKPHLIEFYENEELRDADGKILIDGDGKPQLKPVKKYEFVESQRTRDIEFSFGLKNGIVIKMKSGAK